jgi:hypothetical protein
MGFNRIAGYAGIVFIVLMVINVVLSGSSPMPGDSITELRDYVSGDIGMHKAGLFASILVLPPAALVFAAVIAKVRISDAANGESWSTVALFGAVLIGASAGIGDVLTGTALYRGGDGLDDSTLRALWDGQLIAYSASGIALTALAGSVAVPTLQRGIWPRWYGLLGVVVAVLGVLGLISVVEDSNGGSVFGLLSFIGLAIWMVSTSVLLIREPATGGASTV